MPGRIAIDFGTANTVIANWDTVRQQGVVYSLPQYARYVQANEEQVSVIPSLIHYGAGGQRWYGKQVLDRNLAHSGRSFQWMKRYISMRSPATRKIDDRQITNTEAAEDFLATLIAAIQSELNIKEEELALSLPVESFEHYENWLLQVAARQGLSRIRFIDEPSAAALGYSARLQPDEACLVFDFGAGTLDVSIVKQEHAELVHGSAQRCRVLGKAGAEFGGANIDEWLYQEVLAVNGFSENDPEIQQVSRLILCECESLKERLSFQEKASLTVMNPLSGSVISADFSRVQFEKLLEDKDAYAVIDRTLRRALADASERGFRDENIKAVLMVGGCSQIPSVQSTLKRIFGKERVRLDRPLDAIARGAASFISGQSFDDYLQHDYAIRYRNTSSQQFEYRNLVRKGSRYPSDGPLATVKVKAVYHGQEEFMMQIFEMADPGQQSSNSLELFFDETGSARMNAISPSAFDERRMFWINQKNLTLLKADPPALKGEERFEVSFSVDSNRRLLITARDLKSGRLLHQDFPLVRLS